MPVRVPNCRLVVKLAAVSKQHSLLCALCVSSFSSVVNHVLYPCSTPRSRVRRLDNAAARSIMVCCPLKPEDNLCKAILAAARDAAQLCRLVQEKYLVASAKSSGAQTEPVTIADYGSQAIICRALQAHYPDDAVVAEESGEQFLQLVSDEQRAQVVTLLAQVLRAPVSEAELVAWLDFGVDRSAAPHLGHRPHRRHQGLPGAPPLRGRCRSAARRAGERGHRGRARLLRWVGRTLLHAGWRNVSSARWRLATA